MNSLNNQSDIQLLQTAFEELEKAFQLSITQLKDQYPDNGFLPPMLPISDNRYLNITPNGLYALQQLGINWRKNHPDNSIKSRIDEKKSRQLAIECFGRLAEIYLNQENLDKTTLDKILKDLKKQITEQFNNICRPVEHFFFCQLLLNKDFTKKIEIGPITFYSKEDWMNHVDKTSNNKSKIIAELTQIKDEDPADSEKKNVHRGITKTINQNLSLADRIASVKISGNELGRSYERAKIATCLAIDAYSLLLSSKHAYYLKGPEEILSSKYILRLSQFSGYELSYGGSVEASHMYSLNLDDSTQFTHEDKKKYLKIFGSMIEYITSNDLVNNSELKRLWCDALYWFGEARRSKTAFIKLSMYGFVLDILTCGKQVQGIKELLSALFNIKKNDFIFKGITLDQSINKIYKQGRSQLTHGTKPALLEDLPFDNAQADHLCCQTLIEYAIQLYSYKGNDNYQSFLENLGKNKNECKNILPEP